MSIRLFNNLGGYIDLESGGTSAAANVFTLPAETGTLLTTASTGGVSQAMLATGVGGTGPAFSAFGNTLTSITNNTFTKINFNTEEFDTNSNFASSRFTPTVEGYYKITTSVAGPASGLGVIQVNIHKNGAAFKAGVQVPNVATYGAYLVATALIYCNGSTDFIEIYVFQNTGGTVTGGSNSQDFAFSGFLARSA